MGFFDKVKSFTNKITGDSAKVTVTVEATSIQAPIKVHVRAEMKESLQITKVYLYVKSVEVVDLPTKSVSVNNQQNEQAINLNAEIFKQQEYEVAPAQTLEANQIYDFPYELVLPAGCTPTYQGHYTRHEWKFYAGLDAKGNDPDSGWVTVVIEK